MPYSMDPSPTVSDRRMGGPASDFATLYSTTCSTIGLKSTHFRNTMLKYLTSEDTPPPPGGGSYYEL